VIQGPVATLPPPDPGTSPLWAPVPKDPRWMAPKSEPPRVIEPSKADEYPFEYEPMYVPDEPDSPLNAGVKLEGGEPFEAAPFGAPAQQFAAPAPFQAKSPFEPRGPIEPEPPEPAFERSGFDEPIETSDGDEPLESSDEYAPDDAPLALPVIMTPPPRIKPNVLSPSSFPRVEAAMMDVLDRDRLIELAFSVASCFAQYSGLFVVQQGTLQGLRYAERGALPRPLEGVLVPAGADSMLTVAVKEAKAMRANPEERVIDQHVRELLGDRRCREVGLFPVIIRQRVVNVLYGSNGDEPLGEIAFAALTALAERMGAGYEKLIRSRKAG
jgi:hypothetical protein